MKLTLGLRYTEDEKFVRDRQPFLLAVTVMPGPQLRQAVPVCKQVKAALPDTIGRALPRSTCGEWSCCPT